MTVTSACHRLTPRSWRSRRRPLTCTWAGRRSSSRRSDGVRPSFEQLREHIARRLPRAPRYRQTLKSVPFGINAPVWVDDLDFDISRHVVAARSDRLGEVVEECMSKPLPRQRPCGRSGSPTGSTTGGSAWSARSTTAWSTGSPPWSSAACCSIPIQSAPPPAPDAWAPESPPSGSRLLGRGLTDLARSQLDLAAIPARAARSPRQALELASRARRAAAALLDAARPARRRRSSTRPSRRCGSSACWPGRWTI